jgi:hypothetical protein
MPRTRSGVDAGFPSEIAQPNDLFCLFLVMYPTICRQNPGPRKNGAGNIPILVAMRAQGSDGLPSRGKADGGA